MTERFTTPRAALLLIVTLAFAAGEARANMYAPDPVRLPAGSSPPGCNVDILNSLTASGASGTLGGASNIGDTVTVGNVTTGAAGAAALQTAMASMGIPASEYNNYAYIMNAESSGIVGDKNATSTATGLFQLTQANWGDMPNGAASIGNGVEEAEGGITYIQQRYGTVEAAVAHEQQYHWY